MLPTKRLHGTKDEQVSVFRRSRSYPPKSGAVEWPRLRGPETWPPIRINDSGGLSMPDDVRSSSRTGARGGSSRSTWRSRPRRSFGPAKELSGNATAFADSSDRLVRRLFDTGLRLHKLRMVFDRPDPSAAELRTASDAIAAMLDDLDGLIRETGL